MHTRDACTIRNVDFFRVDLVSAGITVGVLSGIVTKSCINICVAANEPLDSVNGTFLRHNLSNIPVDTSTVALQSINGKTDLFYSPYQLDSAGTPYITFNAVDSAGNVSVTNRTFAIETLMKHLPLALKADNGRVTLNALKGTVYMNGYILARRYYTVLWRKMWRLPASIGYPKANRWTSSARLPLKPVNA